MALPMHSDEKMWLPAALNVGCCEEILKSCDPC